MVDSGTITAMIAQYVCKNATAKFAFTESSAALLAVPFSLNAIQVSKAHNSNDSTLQLPETFHHVLHSKHIVEHDWEIPPQLLQES